LLAWYLRQQGQDLGIVPVRGLPAVHQLDTPEAHQGWLVEVWAKARQRIWIVSPFVAQRAIEADEVDKGIAAARQRGVDVKVFVDAEWAARDEAALQSLQSAGAVVIRVPQIHAKLVVVDDQWIAEGSYNWLSAERVRPEWQRWDRTVVYRPQDHPEAWATIVDRLASWGAADRAPADSGATA